MIGVDRAGAMPTVNTADFDLLLTAAPQPTRDWIAVDAAEIDAMLEHLGAQVRAFGLPAAVLAQVLRIGSGLPVADALLLESFAYSALLGGHAFRDWLLKRGPRAIPSPGTRVRCTREGEILTITLAHPSRRNAIDASMRDELVEYLAFACDDPTLPAVHLRADGTDFSAGGDLAEFGESTDLVRGTRDSHAAVAGAPDVLPGGPNDRIFARRLCRCRNRDSSGRGSCRRRTGYPLLVAGAADGSDAGGGRHGDDRAPHRAAADVVLGAHRPADRCLHGTGVGAGR